MEINITLHPSREKNKNKKAFEPPVKGGAAVHATLYGWGEPLII
jgi:hypothetical protein